jgi:hypothetical protein
LFFGELVAMVRFVFEAVLTLPIDVPGLVEPIPYDLLGVAAGAALLAGAFDTVSTYSFKLVIVLLSSSM